MSDQTQSNGQTRPDGQAQTKRVGDRHSIPDAAKALGISEEAVRGRIKRGSLDSMKVDGQVFVLLTLDQTQPDATERSQSTRRPDEKSGLVARLEDENAFLREELRTRSNELAEQRRIIAGLVQRVPELEAATEQRGAPETDDSDEPRSPSWWRRWFSG